MLPHNSVKWIKRWQMHIGMAAFRNIISESIRFYYKKKWYDLSGWKIYVTPIIRTRINAKKSNYPAKIYFIVMIFQKRRSYPFVLFIPREYFSFKNVKLNTKNWNYPAKNDFTVMIFQKPRSYPIVLVIPQSFLTLILFGHTKRIQHSSICLRYRTKLLLWSVIRFGLPNLQVYPQINFFLRPNKINLRPSRKGRQLSISSLQMTILWLCISMLCCDDTLRSLFATWTSGGFVTVVARNGLKTIQWVVSCSPFLKNGSTVFKIFHGRPQIFMFQWSKTSVT